MNSDIYKAIFRKTAVKTTLLLIYVISVNLLAGYVAVWLNFPSLWGISNVFGEYATPLFMTWGLAHWPSLILLGLPLLLIPDWKANQIQRFRVICLSLFVILIYGVLEKIPFALFPAIDALVAFFLSLIIVPPNYRENPKLIIGLSIFLSLVFVISSHYIYSKWQHRTPEIKESKLMNGLFELKKIEVNKNYRELIFSVDLKQQFSQENTCESALKMSKTLFNSYRFDNEYKRIVMLTFNPTRSDNRLSPYPLGELDQYEEDGEIHIACYIKYKHAHFQPNRI